MCDFTNWAPEIVNLPTVKEYGNEPPSPCWLQPWPIVRSNLKKEKGTIVSMQMVYHATIGTTDGHFSL